MHTVQNVPGKGKGLIATRKLRKGTRILSEEPLFVMPPVVDFGFFRDDPEARLLCVELSTTSYPPTVGKGSWPCATLARTASMPSMSAGSAPTASGLTTSRLVRTPAPWITARMAAEVPVKMRMRRTRT